MHTCSVCDEVINPKRAALGYDTCIAHGEGKRTFTTVPVPKSNYIIATCREQLLSPYSHKGIRL